MSASLDQIIEVLHKAAQLPWCQRTNAVNAIGMSVDPKSDDAVGFCLYGKIERAMFELHGDWVNDYALRALEQETRWEMAEVLRTISLAYTPANWNDMPGRKREEVDHILLIAEQRVAHKKKRTNDTTKRSIHRCS